MYSLPEEGPPSEGRIRIAYATPLIDLWVVGRSRTGAHVVEPAARVLLCSVYRLWLDFGLPSGLILNHNR